jgi:Flp pilus assembly protein CpaB
MTAVTRERLPATAALGLAVLGLVLVLTGGSGSGNLVPVVVAARGLPAGRPVDPAALRILRIDHRDLTPGMLAGVADAVYRVPAVAVPPGEYLTRELLGAAPTSTALRPGARALVLRLDPSANPAPALLRAGARVDVIVVRDAGRFHGPQSRIAARDLVLVAPARSLDGVLAVTVGATLRQAVALTEAQSYAHDVRLVLRGGHG